MDRKQKALAYFEDRFDSYVERLKAIAKIPSVSQEGFPREEVARCADAVATELERAGLENVRTIVHRGSHPYVYGDWLHAPGAPTVLLYAHHDVQPPGRAEVWESPPFEPTLRSNGRLYARGIADDKAGAMMIVSSIESYLKTTGSLPLNVKVLIEGEEEIGSDHLGEFLRENLDMLATDVLVITDTGNHEEGLPSLTFQLRGLVAVDVEVAALKGRVHSGQWGGPVPDPVMALCKILTRLVDENGVPADPDVRAGIREPAPSVKKRISGTSLRRGRVCGTGWDVARGAVRGRAGVLGMGAAVDATQPDGDRDGGKPDRGLVQPDHRRGARSRDDPHRPRSGSDRGARRADRRPASGSSLGRASPHAASRNGNLVVDRPDRAGIRGGPSRAAGRL